MGGGGGEGGDLMQPTLLSTTEQVTISLTIKVKYFSIL